jgi:hypothetical protein
VVGEEGQLRLRDQTDPAHKAGGGTTKAERLDPPANVRLLEQSNPALAAEAGKGAGSDRAETRMETGPHVSAPTTLPYLK